MTVPLIVYADGPDGPAADPAEVAAVAGLDAYELLLGWTLADRPWLSPERGHTGIAVMPNAMMSRPVNDGRFRYLPVRLSAMPRLFEQVRPAVTIVAGVRRGDGFAFRGSVGWFPAACRASDQVIVELEAGVSDIGGPTIPGNVVGTVERPPDVPSAPPEPRPLDDTDLAIGHHLASLVPDDATIQVGPGAIAEALLACIDRPVHIWSGMITDNAARLRERDLLLGTATSGYVCGGEPIAALARDGLLDLQPVEVTHDLTRLSSIPRFVALNAAIQVGFDGSVNVERVGARSFSGIGGHADYCAGAARSVGGLSVIALRSTTKRGDPTIVPTVDVVSTPRCDVDVVVTENGIADLRNATDGERAERISALVNR